MTDTQDDLEERRYTLDEAEREITRRECAMNGHSFDVLTMYGSLDPKLVLCGRCGDSWQMGLQGELQDTGGKP